MVIGTDPSEVLHQNIANQLQINKASHPRILQSTVQWTTLWKLQITQYLFMWHGQF